MEDLRTVLYVLLVVIFLGLALSNREAGKLIPTVIYLLLAELCVWQRERVASLLILVLGLLTIMGFGLLQLLEALGKESAGRIAICGFGYWIFTIPATSCFYQTKILATIGWSLPAIFCALMIFRESRRVGLWPWPKSEQGGG